MTEDQRLSPHDFARKLRRTMTVPERRLWTALRDRRMAGVKFRRQHPIGIYTVDFACADRRVAIEVDGASHDDRGSYDERREAAIRSSGWSVIRVSYNDVNENIEGVLIMIADAVGIDSKHWLCKGLGQHPDGIL